MEREIQDFIRYLHGVKNTSDNTEISYQRDLRKLSDYMKTCGIVRPEELTATGLNAYVLNLEKHGFAASSVSRSIASIKAFCNYLNKIKVLNEDITANLKPPKIQKKIPEILTVDEMNRLLDQPESRTAKDIRDKAMLELLYATGIRVSELISLKTDEVNLKLGYIVCRDGDKERVIPIGDKAKAALEKYLQCARKDMLKDENDTILFTNCSGSAMSRQGFWKLIKYYAKRAGIMKEITPHTFRHSFAAHLVENGAEIHAVQEMMGHADISATQIYLNMNNRVRENYAKAHPRS